MRPIVSLLGVFFAAFQGEAFAEVEWEKTFGGQFGDIATSVEQTSDGGYIVAGEENSFGHHNAWYLLKLDAAGELDPAWPENPKSFLRSERGGGFAACVEQTSDGGYIVAGDLLVGDFVVGSDLASRFAVLKLDAAGNLDPAWPENPRTFGDGIAWSVQQTSDGGYIVAGGSFGPVMPMTPSDVYLVKLDRAGHLDPEWPENPKSFDDGFAHSVEQTSDGGYIVAGSTTSFGAGSSDVYLIKVGPSIRFQRGDVNADGVVDLVDGVFTLNFLFLEGEEPSCRDAADTDDSGVVGLSDGLKVFHFLFLGREAPPTPFPDCGSDSTKDELDCLGFSACP